MILQESGLPGRIHCLLLDQYSLLSFASVTEPFLACNQLCGERRYHIEYIGYGDQISSDGRVSVQTEINLNQPDAIEKCTADILIVCGGLPLNFPQNTVLLDDLSRMKNAYRKVIGVATGGVAMAKAGLLAHKKASLHWWNSHSLRSEFSDIYFSQDLYSVDGNMATCRGGSSAMDLSFSIIGQAQGSDMVEALSDHFLRERLGVNGARNNETKIIQPTAQHPKLDEAIKLMDANIDEPLSTEDIANHIQLSIRQFERLFKHHFKSTPSQYYLDIRLEKARAKLLTTHASITDIALACGFSSTAHFSTRYRHQFGLTPTEDRALQNT